MSKKISLEVLKETRPEKELSSDSESSSGGEGAHSPSHRLPSLMFIIPFRADSDSDAKGKGLDRAKAGAASNDDSDSENDEDYKADDKSSSGGSPSSR